MIVPHILILTLLFLFILPVSAETFHLDEYNSNVWPMWQRSTTKGNDVDFGPWMREFMRRCKMNWEPPKGCEYLPVIVSVKVDKHGKLLDCKIYKTSREPRADKAAMKAVEVTAPFRPLPDEYKGESVEIQVTFGY